jgi:Cu2+-exporting ATPase/Cu+-exporting ATPase
MGQELLPAYLSDIELTNKSKKVLVCAHCDEDVLIKHIDDGKVFCCLGCQTVYQLIKQKGLGEYYQIKNDSEIYKRRAPVANKNQRFSYLGNPDFLTEYAYQNHSDQSTMEFYLEGIHCLACLWLIEKMPEFLPAVSHSHLDTNKSIATISMNAGGSFCDVARELNNLGYAPHPLKRHEKNTNYKLQEERKMLLKIGIAGAGAANIMLYAISIYAGADGNYQKVFNLLTIFFAFPVFLYSATPFYQNAWSAIKYRRLSIDIPISLSLIVGFAVGLYYQFIGINENFFDSLTALVFLLLLSRYFLNKIQEEGLKANDLSFFYQTKEVLKRQNDLWIPTHPKYLNKGDLFKASTNEMLPVDGIIESGETIFNNSLLTGESRPVTVNVGSKVYSGTINLGDEVIVKVQNTDEKTRLGKILENVEKARKNQTPIVDLTNRISKYFILIVLSLASIVFLKNLWSGNLYLALDKGLTLLIVTCPCALALATPLTLTRTLTRASKLGIIIKNDEVIEKLSKIKNVFLDKTGTITFGQLKIIDFKILKKAQSPIQNIIISLENKSKHPVAIALCEYASHFENANLMPVKNYSELIAQGVSGTIENRLYEISKGQIFEDKILVATYQVDDKIRPEANFAINELKKLNVGITLVSGDQKNIVNEIAREIGLKEQFALSDQTPEDKLSLIEKNSQAMMVGDGANDAMALSKAYVGVAVQGSMDISLRAAEIYLTTPGIKQIADLIILSRETMKVIYRNLVLSLLYNGASVYLAFAGLISPLTAAIIMPISSLTVLTSTLIGTKKLNKILNHQGGHKWKS